MPCLTETRWNTGFWLAVAIQWPPWGSSGWSSARYEPWRASMKRSTGITRRVRSVDPAAMKLVATLMDDPNPIHWDE